MVIKYSLIARNSTILCSQRARGEDVNYENLMMSILPNIPTGVNAKTSYTSANDLIFNVIVEDGLIYLCASDRQSGTQVPFAFLNEVKRRFSSGTLLQRAQYADEGDLTRDFSPVLNSQMERYSSETNGHLDALRSQVDEVKDVMTQNIERVLERGQRLEELMNRTEDLEASASTFQKSSRQVRRHMCCKNAKMTIILIVVSIVVLLVLILIILFSTGVLPPKGGGGTTTPTLPSTTTSKSL